MELLAVVDAWVEHDHGYLGKYRLGVLEDVVGAHERVYLAHAGDEDHVAPGHLAAEFLVALAHDLEEGLGGGDLFHAPEQALGAAALLQRGDLFQDAALLADLQEHVPQVEVDHACVARCGGVLRYRCAVFGAVGAKSRTRASTCSRTSSSSAAA